MDNDILSGKKKAKKVAVVDLGKKGSFKSHKGRLHRALGVPEDQPIPKSKLEAAAHSDRVFEGSKVSDMVRSAKGLEAMHHGK